MQGVKSLRAKILELLNDGQVHDLDTTLQVIHQNSGNGEPSPDLMHRFFCAWYYLAGEGLIKRVSSRKYVITLLGQILAASHCENLWDLAEPSVYARDFWYGDCIDGDESSLKQDIRSYLEQCEHEQLKIFTCDLLEATKQYGVRSRAPMDNPKSYDRGIDAVFKVDPIGVVELIGVQIKTKQDKEKKASDTAPEVQKGKIVVGDVRDFAGALQALGARKGVMVTNSTFTDHAYDYVSSIQRSIVLLDIDELVRLALEYRVGIIEDICTVSSRRIRCGKEVQVEPYKAVIRRVDHVYFRQWLNDEART